MKTAQDLFDWVGQDLSRTEHQRRNEQAAIKWLGRVDSMPLAAIPLEARYLIDDRIRLIRGFKGVKKKRRSGIVSLLNGTLKRAGIIRAGARRDGITGFAWTVLISDLPTRDARKDLSTLAKFFSARQIEPKDVTLEGWQEFVDETLYRSTFKRPRATIQKVLAACARARANDPVWPLPNLPKLENSRKFSVARHELPESLVADLATYIIKSTTRPKSRFDKTWPTLRAPQTIARHREHLWRTASAQVHAGRNPIEIVDLAALLDFDWLQNAMDWLVLRAGDQFLKDHLNMAATWISVSERYLRAPKEVVNRLREDIFEVIEKDLGPPEFSEKNMRRLDQFDSPEIVHNFLMLPYTIWEEVRAKKKAGKLTLDDATEMMAAVAIEILITTLIRRKNLADIDLTKNFWPVKPTANRRWTLRIDPEEVKNKQRLDFKLQPESVDLIQFFVKECRPLLLKQPTNMLFLRADGTPKGLQGMYHLIKSCVWRRLGLEVNTHLFRHIGAMLFLDAHPGQLEVVRIMLGHTTSKTTERFYARLKRSKAIQFFTAAVLGGRAEAIRRLKLR